eukprot:CAMPEP_0119318302 /NCGR_PEP_ID=MMETSP1333-20130426/45999_1 /TAXON_ID=418940 /ORGANISM="Scyphosphaera apsteinii, Strain RCC1455" /LENGTH=154 /DNA_ID=CAMNT_0007324449 /DNA_START=52 /DNA_END=517 /DNA_ORIENTATION=-
MPKVYSPPNVVPGSPRERNAKLAAEKQSMEEAQANARNQTLSVKERWVEGKINHWSDPNARLSQNSEQDEELQKLRQRSSGNLQERNSLFKEESPATPSSSSYRDEQEKELRLVRANSSGTVKERNSQFEEVARNSSPQYTPPTKSISKEELAA